MKHMYMKRLRNAKKIEELEAIIKEACHAGFNNETLMEIVYYAKEIKAEKFN